MNLSKGSDIHPIRTDLDCAAPGGCHGHAAFVVLGTFSQGVPVQLFEPVSSFRGGLGVAQSPAGQQDANRVLLHLKLQLKSSCILPPIVSILLVKSYAVRIS